MRCAVYKSIRKPDCYLYVERQEDFSRVPAGLIDILGRLEFVMQIDLSARQKLAQAYLPVVIAELRERGFYLQIPRDFMGFQVSPVFRDSTCVDRKERE